MIHANFSASQKQASDLNLGHNFGDGKW